MNPGALVEIYRLQHSHRDGSWGDMVEDRSHHSPADHDPERGWRDGLRFRCTSCNESVTIRPEEPDLPEREP